MPTAPVQNDGWVSPWGKNVIEGTENGVVLYRVEFSLYDDSLFPSDVPIKKRLDDPFFFYRPSTCNKWANIVRVVGIGKYEDLIKVIYQKDANGKDTDTIASVDPTVTFRTSSVENDSFNPAFSTDTKNEYPNATPTVFSGNYGYWTLDYRVDVMRGDYYDSSSTSGVDYYTKLCDGKESVLKNLPGVEDDPLEFDIAEYFDIGFVKPDAERPRPLEMAFTVDENRGTVNFALEPPRPDGVAKSGPVCILYKEDFNAISEDFYGGAQLEATLATFDLIKHRDQYIKNARIVPGSEKVIGPDITNPSKLIRYNRVPYSLGYPQSNQYRINYDTGKIYCRSDLSLYLSGKEQANANAAIQVYYLIYFNDKDDVVRGDYFTKSLINVHIGMRMFDPDSGKPFPVDPSNKVKIRNAIR